MKDWKHIYPSTKTKSNDTSLAEILNSNLRDRSCCRREKHYMILYPNCKHMRLVVISSIGFILEAPFLPWITRKQNNKKFSQGLENHSLHGFPWSWNHRCKCILLVLHLCLVLVSTHHSCTLFHPHMISSHSPGSIFLWICISLCFVMSALLTNVYIYKAEAALVIYGPSWHSKRSRSIRETVSIIVCNVAK